MRILSQNRRADLNDEKVNEAIKDKCWAADVPKERRQA
jgi:hypothetical protein